MSKRGYDWLTYSQIVFSHINNYTVPQYGDAPDDEVEDWTPSQCVNAISKYAKRFESGRRGRIETARDLVKIAHFAQLAFDKMNLTISEIIRIEEGNP